MLWDICIFELRYQLRRIWPWLGFFTVLGIVYLTSRAAPVDDATYANTFINSSFTVAMNTVIGCLVWLLVGAPVAGEAAARDAATLMHPLTYTSHVSKRDYLFGRFLAAITLNAFIMLGVTAGLMLATYQPGTPESFVGPFRVAALVNPFIFIALPNVLVVTSIQFAIATLSRRPMAAYLGSIFVFFISYVVGLIVAFALRDQELSKLLDPIGPFFIFGELPEGWTAIEKNTRLLMLEGTLLTNRLIWLSVAGLVLAMTYSRFRFEHWVKGSLWRRLLRRPTRVPLPSVEPRIVPTYAPTRALPAFVQRFDFVASMRQMLAIARVSLGKLVRMRAGLDVLLFVSLLAVVIMPFNLETAGVPIIPHAERVLKDFTTPLTNFATPFTIIPLLIVYWAGELVWRERDARLGEINDASPIPQWAMFSGKLLALVLMCAVFMLLMTVASILVQVITGATPEPGRFVQILFGFQLWEYVLFAVLALVVHATANNRYVGHLLGIVIYGLIATSGLIGLEHKMLIWGASPSWSFTQMRGFGPSVAPWLWFKLYWAAWALVLCIASILLWPRGKEGTLRARMRAAKAQFTAPVAAVGSIAIVALTGVGGFVFYNTNVLHTYYTTKQDNIARAEYEQRYAQWARLPQPRVASTNVRLELHPERGVADVQGAYMLVNNSAQPIDSVMVAPHAEVRLDSLSFDREITLAITDAGHLTRVYALRQPLLPGDSLQMTFDLQFAPRGFTNSGRSVAVVDNGTQIKLSEWLPGIGYQSKREILKPKDRVELGLPVRPVIPVVEDEAARYHIGQRTLFEAIVGTSEDQTAVAPGMLLRTWNENGRRYFHYKTDAPIGGEMPVLSARYAVLEEQFVPSSGAQKPIAIRINYHPGHKDIVDNVLRGVRATLDYGTKHFGPYPYGHVTVSERAAGGMGLNAESGNIDYSEQFATLAPEKNPNAFDFPIAVLGHEMGHNFGPPIAAVEGAPVVSESFGWYVGINVLGHASGREDMVRLLNWMHQPYPHKPIKGGAPLIRGLDPWTGYRRGPFALFALREYVGEDRINGAIKAWREKHFAPGAPPATTLTLYRELDAATPDSLKYLLRDLFMENTFWELGVSGTAKPGNGESWDVTLEITARKFVVDSAGKETDVPMNDLVDVGVFGSPNLRVPTDPLYFEKRRVVSGRQTITVNVPRKPARVGVDPYLLLLDLDSNNNWEAVGISGR